MNHLLTIAINRYAAKGWADLRGPELDVDALNRVLCDRYGFQDKHCLDLRNENATKRNIMAAFRSLASHPASDSLVVYYAGHGHQDEFDKTGFWVPHDGGTDELVQANWIPNSTIRATLLELPFRHILVFCDSCFSGTLLPKRDLSQGRDQPEFVRNAMRKRSREILTSGSDGPVADVALGGHSPFAFHLLRTLADCPYEDGWLDAHRLYDHIRSGVTDQAPLAGTLPSAGHQKGGAFFFQLVATKEHHSQCSPPSPPPAANKLALLDICSDPSGATFLLDGGQREGTTPCQLAEVPWGRHHCSAKLAGEPVEEEFEISTSRHVMELRFPEALAARAATAERAEQGAARRGRGGWGWMVALLLALGAVLALFLFVQPVRKEEPAPAPSPKSEKAAMEQHQATASATQQKTNVRYATASVERERVTKVDRGQGIGAMLDAMELKWREAEAARQGKSWQQALDGYDAVLKQCKTLLQHETDRRQAIAQQKDANTARQVAVMDGAALAAKELLEKATEASTRAAVSFEAGAFAAAETSWWDATATFVESGTHARGVRDYRQVKSAYEAKLAPSKALLEQHGGEKWREVLRQSRIGAGNAQKPGAGGKAYKMALSALPAALAEAEENAKPKLRVLAKVNGQEVKGATVSCAGKSWQTPVTLVLERGVNYLLVVSMQTKTGKWYGPVIVRCVADHSGLKEQPVELVEQDIAGKVVRVEYGRALLNVGSLGGMRKGVELLVVRQEGRIAKLRVSEVTHNASVADIVPDSLRSPLRIGDCVVLDLARPVLGIATAATRDQFIGRTIVYDIKVTNKGGSPATNLVVEDILPAGAAFVSASSGGRASAGKVAWKVASLAPKATVAFKVTAKAVGAGTLKNQATAVADCAAAVSDTASTVVRGKSAILLEVIDVADPLSIGDMETYIITATNQGTAPDTNIKIVCTLKDNEIFQSAAGPAGSNVAGSHKAGVVTFTPLASLAAKARATWQVKVKGVKVGDVRFAVEMTSDELKRPVRETESTQIY